MDKIFIEVLNINLTAGFIALAVILMRLMLRKAPKWIFVLMWAFVGIRLICPFSPTSELSVLPSAEPIPGEILYTQTPAISTGVPVLNSVVNPIISDSLAPDPTASINPMQVVMFVCGIVWLVGIALMLLYTLICCLKIKHQVKEAAILRNNILICDNVDSPFIFGVIRPRIYLPSSLDEKSTEYVIAHENAHIKRGDHLWKPLGFLLLTVYWFNPILWLAYILLCRDIEAACDEKVIGNMDAEGKKNYSNALIECSSPRRIISACPIAFGETNVKGRIKNVLNYKKPAFWIIIVALIACIVASVCLLTDPVDDSSAPKDTSSNDASSIIDGIDSSPLDFVAFTYSIAEYRQYFKYDATNGIDVYVTDFKNGEFYYRFAEHKLSGCDHSGTSVYTHIDAMDARSAAAALSTYGLPSNKINYYPYGDTPYDCIDDARKAVESILPKPTEQELERIYDRTAFDIDGDGKVEYLVAYCAERGDECYITVTAIDPTAKKPKCITSCRLDAYGKAKFVDHNDGKLYINGIKDGRFFEYALGYVTSEINSYFSAHSTMHLSSLQKMYPEYFAYDLSKGVDVCCYVTSVPTLHLLPPYNTAIGSESDVASLPALTFEQVSLILSAYKVPKEKVMVKTIYAEKAYSPPEASYGIFYPERPKALQRYIIERLYSKEKVYPIIEELPFHDFYVFDIDNDGKEEKCLLAYGYTSGIYTVTVKIAEFGKSELEYEALVEIPYSYSEPQFVKENDKFYVMTTDEDNIYYYDICISDNGRITFEKAKVMPIPTDGEYSQYLDLDASNGLDVIVWQMGNNSFSFALLPHKDGEYGLIIDELMNVSGTDAITMRAILNTYSISNDDIYVVPWQHPLSSHISSIFLIGEDGKPLKSKEEYINEIRLLLRIY